MATGDVVITYEAATGLFTSDIEAGDTVQLNYTPTAGLTLGASATSKVGLFGVIPVTQPSGAGQAAVTFTNTDDAIGGLTISASYSQVEIEALRNACETLADDCRNLNTLVTSLRTALFDLGLIKGSV